MPMTGGMETFGAIQATGVTLQTACATHALAPSGIRDEPSYSDPPPVLPEREDCSISFRCFSRLFGAAQGGRLLVAQHPTDIRVPSRSSFRPAHDC
jgi:hypothetical protein